MSLSFDRATKLIEVPDTDTEVTIQSLVNEIRDYEDNLSTIDLNKMLNAYGKQPLGGGVLVGITIELLDGWRIQFADRAGPNYTQCSVTGGNVIAYDESDVQQFPIYPSDYVFATITASSSATLSELSAIQYSSFGDCITVDIINGQSGIAFPIGTIESPVDNIPDAVTIAETRGFTTIHIIKDITLTTGDNLEDYLISGQSIIKSQITIDAGALVTGTEFIDATITGILDGNNVMHHSSLYNLTHIEGHIHDCLLEDTTITLAGDGATLLTCWSGGITGPTIDFDNDTRELIVRGYSGDITISNTVTSCDLSIDLESGSVTLDSSCNGGDFLIRGVGSFINNSTSTDSINTSGLICADCLTNAIWDEPKANHISTGSIGEAITNIHDESLGKWVLDTEEDTMTYYEADGITILQQFTLPSELINNIKVYTGRTPV